MTSPSVYFYCREEEGNLQEDVIALAEGFKALGIRYFANTNYWQQSTTPGDYLFKHDPTVSPDDCDLVVVSYTWPSWLEPNSYRLIRRPLPEGLFKPGRRYRTIYMDSHDGYRTVSWEPEFRQFDLILRSKLNQRAWHPENMRPWVLGLNRRIIDATTGGLPFGQRSRKLLVNFGASHPYPHGTREIAMKLFEPKILRALPFDRTKDDLSQPPVEPYEALMWQQTGHRFSRAYYERLKQTQAVACFCGDMIPPAPFRHPDRYLAGGKRAELRRMLFDAASLLDTRPPRAVQWDSFRFWEAMSAGCAAINIDLPKYGVQLPVMPANWEHYIGIDFDHVDKAVDRIVSDPGLLERVAAGGQQWATAHYSPKAMAERVIRWALTEHHAVTRQGFAGAPALASGAAVAGDLPFSRVARKANQTLVWLRSVRSPLDWPAAIALAMFRTRPPQGDGPIDRAIRWLLPHVWIHPKLLGGLRLRIDPSRMSHFTIYEELLIENAYNLDLLKFVPDVVIDCGAFEGYFALLARAKFGAMPLVAFEPNPENFKGLVANVKGNGLSFDTRASAVSTRDGEAMFAGGGCGGHLTRNGKDRSVRVPLENLRRVIGELGPKRLLLKIDVEGEERAILPDILPSLPQACAMFFEWHHGPDSFHDAVTMLERSGFSVDARRSVVQADTGETFIDAFAQRT
jgi:FkbM family methyltransferase